MSSVHGSYRSVAETEEAIRLISETLLDAKPASALWLLDQPVSNSGRLAQRIREMAAEHNWPWGVEVVMNPDKVLRSSEDRKSTRLNSSHLGISYAVFCFKKQNYTQ